MKAKMVLCHRSWLTALSPDVAWILLLLAYELGRIEENGAQRWKSNSWATFIKRKHSRFLLQPKKGGCSCLSQVTSFNAPDSSKRQKNLFSFIWNIQLYVGLIRSLSFKVESAQWSFFSRPLIVCISLRAMIRSQRHRFKVRAAFRKQSLPSPELWISYYFLQCGKVSVSVKPFTCGTYISPKDQTTDIECRTKSDGSFEQRKWNGRKFVNMEKHNIYLTPDHTNKYEPKWTPALPTFACEAAFSPPCCSGTPSGF